MASQVLLSVLQDNDVTIDFTITRQDRTTPQDLTGLIPSMIIKPDPSDPDSEATATLTTADGLTVTDAAGGLLTAFLSHALLASPGTAWYRLDFTDGAGSRTTALLGLLVTNCA